MPGEQDGARHVTRRVAHFLGAGADQFEAEHAVDDRRDVLQTLAPARRHGGERQGLAISFRRHVAPGAENDRGEQQ
jgi:hypothetical protein